MQALRRTLWGLGLALLCGEALAQEPTPEMSAKTVDIHSPTLLKALIALQQQTGLQFICPTDGTGETPVARVEGTYTPKVVIEKLLEGSGIRYEFINERTVAISSNQVKYPQPAQSSMLEEELLKTGARDQTSLARTDNVTQSDTLNVKHGGNEIEEIHVSIPEILIEGSRTLNMDIKRSRDDVQPYVVFDRQAIEQSAAANIEDFLRNRLSASTTSESASQSPTLTGNISSIRLRGLSANETLILIDGHRTAPNSLLGGALQPDLNGIPLSMVERIEVLPTTASGIYGGSATGGVINVILRRDYQGLQTHLAYDNSFDGGGATRQVDVSGGFTLENGRTNVLLSGSYSDADDLLVGDRNFTRRGRQHILDRNPAAILNSFYPPLGATTNVQSSTGESLTLKSDGTSLGFTRTFIPSGYAGTASDNGAALIDNAGAFNLGLANTAQTGGGGRQSLLNAPTVRSFMGTVRREFTPRVQAFLELSGASNHGEFRNNTSSISLDLSELSPANPFNQPISLTTPALGADQTVATDLDTRRAMGGVIVALPHAWNAELDYTWNQTRFVNKTGGDADSFAVLADAEAGSLDFFRNTNAAGTDFSTYIPGANSTKPGYARMKDSALRLSGPLGYRLPGGAATLTFLGEHREEQFDNFVQSYPGGTTTAYGRSQAVDSAYMELRAPIVSSLNARAGLQLLEFQLAGRWDNYRMIGANNSSSSDPQEPIRPRNDFSSVDPTVGFKYQPVSDLTVRASYGTGFLPPGLDKFIAYTPFVLTADSLPFYGLTDPARAGEVIGGGGDVTLFSGGNSNLRPEQSESRSIGVILTPRALPGLRASVDWIGIEKTDNIALLSFDNQANLDNEALIPGYVIRGAARGDGYPVGPITGLNASFINIARRSVEAFDFALDYRYEMGSFGVLELSSSATRNVHNRTRLSPGAEEVENVGINATDGGLEWTGNATATWGFRRWAVGWTARYFDSYYLNAAHSVVPNQSSATIPGQTYHDLFARFHFDSTRLGSLKNLEAQLGVRNVFNKSPPLDATSPAHFYSTWGDPRLASYNLSVTAAF